MPTEIKKPIADTVDSGTGFTNPNQAYDFSDTGGDESTYADAYNAADFIHRFHTWASKGFTYTTTQLHIKWNTSGGFSDDQFAIQYTKDGGLQWNDLVPLGVHNETAIQDSNVALDANQDLTLVEVKVIFDRVGGGDKDTVYLYDIWTEGTYIEMIQVNGQADGGSNVDGNVNIKRDVSAQSDGGSGVSGTVSTLRGVVGQVDGGSGVSGSINATRTISGQSDGGSNASGMLFKIKKVSGQANGSSLVVGNVKIFREIGGEISGTSDCSGNVGVNRTILAQADGGSSVLGNININRAVSAQSDGSSDISGIVEIKRKITAQVDGDSDSLGNANVYRFVLGEANGGSNATGNLSKVGGGADIQKSYCFGGDVIISVPP